MNDTRMLGLVPFDRDCRRHSVVEEHVRKQKVTAMFCQSVDMVGGGKTDRLPVLRHYVLNVDFRSSGNPDGVDNAVYKHIGNQTGVQRTGTDRDYIRRANRFESLLNGSASEGLRYTRRI